MMELENKDYLQEYLDIRTYSKKKGFLYFDLNNIHADLGMYIMDIDYISKSFLKNKKVEDIININYIDDNKFYLTINGKTRPISDISIYKFKIGDKVSNCYINQTSHKKVFTIKKYIIIPNLKNPHYEFTCGVVMDQDSLIKEEND